MTTSFSATAFVNSPSPLSSSGSSMRYARSSSCVRCKCLIEFSSLLISEAESAGVRKREEIHS